METISEAFVLWDNQNRLVMCNSKYQQFHGLADDMVQPGASYDEVIAAASEPIVSKRIAVAGKEADDSRTYEAQIEGDAAASGALVLCQYDVRRFSGEDLLRALECHAHGGSYPLVLARAARS